MHFAAYFYNFFCHYDNNIILLIVIIQYFYSIKIFIFCLEHLAFGFEASAPLPDVGEWNRLGATIELNGEKIAPPKWKRPGLKKGNPVTDWTPAWTLYEADEEPFTDQEYFMREPTPIRLRKGWNHVRLTIPNPAEGGKTRHRWTGTFIPVEGATDHPHEVQGLEYASVPPV